MRGFLNALLAGTAGAGEGVAEVGRARRERANIDLERRRLEMSDPDRQRAVQAVREAAERARRKQTLLSFRKPDGTTFSDEEAELYLDNPTLLGNALRGREPEPNEVIVRDGKRVYVRRSQAVGQEAPAPAGPSGSFVQMTGPDGQPVLFNPTTKHSVTPPAGARLGASTEAQQRANLVLPRAEQAAGNLDEFFEKGAPPRSLMSRVPIVGNFVMSEDEQRMVQAAEAVASAILRMESGAAVTEGEIKSYARQFLPAPGDSPEVRAQKKATLEQQLQAMRAQTSPGSLGASVLSAADRAKAAEDHGFAAWLRARGHKF